MLRVDAGLKMLLLYHVAILAQVLMHLLKFLTQIKLMQVSLPLPALPIVKVSSDVYVNLHQLVFLSEWSCVKMKLSERD